MYQISIIIPVYQVRDYIIECLSSILSQQVNYELILIDDCGSDDSITLAQSYLQSQSTRIKASQWSIITHTKNRGPSAARNSGIRAARGKYLFFLDGDDYLYEHALERLLEAAESTQAELAIGNIEILTGEERKHAFAEGEVVEGKEVVWSYLRRDWHESAGNKLVLRDFVLHHKLTFVEDILREYEVWSLKLAAHMPRLVAIKAHTYCYRDQREGSSMHTLRHSDALRASHTTMRVWQLILQIGIKYELLSNSYLQHRLHLYLYEIFNHYPTQLNMSWMEKWKYYETFAEHADPRLSKGYGYQIYWRIQVIGAFCCLPSYLAGLLLMLFFETEELEYGKLVHPDPKDDRKTSPEANRKKLEKYLATA